MAMVFPHLFKGLDSFLILTQEQPSMLAVS
jgi:hypothetical protein